MEKILEDVELEINEVELDCERNIMAQRKEEDGKASTISKLLLCYHEFHISNKKKSPVKKRHRVRTTLAQFGSKFLAEISDIHNSAKAKREMMRESFVSRLSITASTSDTLADTGAEAETETGANASVFDSEKEVETVTSVEVVSSSSNSEEEKIQWTVTRRQLFSDEENLNQPEAITSRTSM